MSDVLKYFDFVCMDCGELIEHNRLNIDGGRILCDRCSGIRNKAWHNTWGGEDD